MRIFTYISLVLCAAAAAAGIALFNATVCFAEGESYTFFCGNTSADCRIVTVDGAAALTKLTLKDVCGESTRYSGLDIEEFLNSVNGKIIFTEELSDSVNYYCTADLPYSITLYGQEINLHICVKKDGVQVASPIIFGGY